MQDQFLLYPKVAHALKNSFEANFMSRGKEKFFDSCTVLPLPDSLLAAMCSLVEVITTTKEEEVDAFQLLISKSKELKERIKLYESTCPDVKFKLPSINSFDVRYFYFSQH